MENIVSNNWLVVDFIIWIEGYFWIEVEMDGNIIK